MKKARGRSGFLAVCIAPAVILFFVFMILPTLNVFRMSLFEKGAYSPNETFVGLKNFKTLISDTNFKVHAKHDFTYCCCYNSYLCICTCFCRHSVKRTNQGTEFFPYYFLYSQYFIGCSNCRYFFCNL